MKPGTQDLRIRRQLLRVSCVVCMLMSSLLHAETSELSSARMLATVQIDDLIGGREGERGLEASETQKHRASLDADTMEKNTVPSVKKEVFVLDERTVLDEIKFQIASHFAVQGDLRLYFEKPWQEIRMDSPVWEIVMTSLPAQGLRSRFYVSFELWIDGKRHMSRQEGMRSELWVDAYVAMQQIERGAVMRDGLVSVKPVDSLSFYQGCVDIGTNLTDYIAVNGIKAGEPVFWRDLRERPLIQKNALIDVVAEEGNLKITLKAKALEDGAKGQLIRIRNLQSSNDIQAEVIGINQAKVYF